MIDQEKLDREYVEGLESKIEYLGGQLRSANNGLDRYRKENLELENRLESADREIEGLRTRNVRLLGAISEAQRAFSQAVWTPRRHGAETE